MTDTSDATITMNIPGTTYIAEPKTAIMWQIAPKKRYIIGFDVDSTVAELATPWLEAYNLEYHDNMVPDDIKGWHIENYVKPECGTGIFKYLTPEIYDIIKPIPGAVEAVNMAREFGRVIFVTSAEHTPGVKHRWLNKWGFGVAYADYIECRDKYLINMDVLIDDCGDNTSFFKNGIIYDQPWNRDYAGFRIKNFTDDLPHFRTLLRMICG